MRETWPGLDSVGGRAWLTPHRPLSSITPRRNGALYLPRSSGSKNLSALSPSAARTKSPQPNYTPNIEPKLDETGSEDQGDTPTRRTRRLAGAAERRGGTGSMPCTMGDLK